MGFYVYNDSWECVTWSQEAKDEVKRRREKESSTTTQKNFWEDDICDVENDGPVSPGTAQLIKEWGKKRCSGKGSGLYMEEIPDELMRFVQSNYDRHGTMSISLDQSYIYCTMMEAVFKQPNVTIEQVHDCRAEIERLQTLADDTNICS